MDFKLIPKSEFDRLLPLNENWVQQLELYTAMLRYNTLIAVKKAGSGHLGSSFSATDLSAFLYLHEMNIVEKGLDSPDRDIYFSSKGHDVPGTYSLYYALGILSGEKLLGLRRLNGLDGHPEVRQPGIESSTGSLGMGISKGKGMAFAKTYSGYEGHVYVMTGDGEWQEGQIYESLQATAHQEVNNITVIIDHNKYQTDMLVSDVNNIEDLMTKGQAFGWHTVRVDGHDFKALKKTFDDFKQVTDKPKLIIADTIKGKGVSFMAQPDTEVVHGKRYYKWHSGAPDAESFKKGLDELKQQITSKAEALGIEPVNIPEFEIEIKASFKSDKEFVTQAYGDTLVKLGKTNQKLIVLDGDLSADCKLRNFEYTYPGRFIENGIAEQDMVSMAGGLAHMGLLPVVNTFGSFLAARANEQIYNNAGEMSKVIYTCHFSGLIPAGPGKSHQSVRDISLFSALPNVTILQPCNGQEAKWVTEYCVNEAKENCVIRLVIGPSPETIELPEDYEFSFGKGCAVTEGTDAALFAYGPVMMHEALLAQRYLTEYGFGLKVINMPWLNKVDKNWVAEVTSGIEKVFVLEDHSVIGGLGDRLLNAFNDTGAIADKKIRKIGVFDYPECGTPWEVLQYHGLDGKSLAKTISGRDDIGEDESVKQKYTADAPQ